eukprot:2184021-Pyramimonas_sp.AAC.1
MLRDGSHDAPRGPKTAAGRLKVAKELPQERPRRGPNPPKPSGKSICWAVSPFRFRWPSEASR